MATEISAEKLAELKSLGGDALIAKLLLKFVENSEKLLAEARTAVTAGDASKVDYCVHTLKGSSLSLGLTSMSTILVDFNHRTKAKNLEGAAADLDQLDKLLIEAREYKAKNFP